MSTLERRFESDQLDQRKRASRKSTQKAMRILIAGAGGLIGSAVADHLADQGHTVLRLVRRMPGTDEIAWDPDAGTINADGLEGFDGVVHLASLPQARWTPAFIKRWRANHVGTNRLLGQALSQRKHKPSVFVSASAQGIYAPSGDEILTEDSPLGRDYLAELLRAAEEATKTAGEAGIRVVNLRIPTVLSRASLTTMGSNIRQLGNGQQWFSWIARDEMASIVEHVLVTSMLAGPVNAVSPNPVRNEKFFATLGRLLGRKPRLPIPAFLLRLMLGGMADALMLASRRIVPCRLFESRYAFRFPDLESALRHELKM